MVVQSRAAGESVRFQYSLTNTDTVLLDGERQLDSQTAGFLPLPDIMPCEAGLLQAPMRRHKSTTDIPYSPYRGHARGQRLSIYGPAEMETAQLRRCSLRESNGQPRWCARHALSAPNMVTGVSPFRSMGTPSRSGVSTPQPELEKYVKVRSKLLEDECAQTPTCTPEARQQLRYVTKDGKCRVNLAHISETGRFLSDIFTSFVDLQYRWFLFLFMMCYAVTWFFFAGLYLLNAYLRGDLGRPGNSAADRVPCYHNVDDFISALLFSVETQRTIGYGSRTVSPACHEGVLLVMVQCIVGSMIDALTVGCMFVKISRPKKRAETLLFSRTCVVANRDDQLCLMFRIGDLRESHMVDAKVRAKLIKSRQTAEGEFLPLEQTEIDLGYESGSDRLFLVEPQVIQHTIDASSPFWEVGPDQLRRQQFEIIVILEGIVEATGMMCQAKTSYIETEIEWGARFEPCMTMEKGAFRVDLRRFHSTYEVPLCSARQTQQLQMFLDLEQRDPGTLSSEWGAADDCEEGEDREVQKTHGFGIDKIQEERVSELNEC
ncbi:G protein-activated inward rectifier potassium channel 3-like [Megalops cyprinoides]|uniref:G protein-activated inward rectifier potassium channel 3-like n=1 Tax=Megalops cyprinoides TaxID=118141 RepID=UPI0018650B7F|nr:G protein-activated inward rectifier potassium channel 3-like [Megalops cyprinoides]